MASTPTRYIEPLARDTVVKPRSMLDDELTYFADGTRVARRGVPLNKRTLGIAAGMTTDAVPYQFQVVQWDDGTTTNTAPQVLIKVTTGAMHTPCEYCGFPIAVVDGVLVAPGGLDSHVDDDGRTRLTPHSNDCGRPLG